MNLVRSSVAALVALGVLVSAHSPTSHARPAAVRISTIYTTTDAAYTAFNPSHALPPPTVTKFPTNVKYIAVYFEYSGAVAKSTSFRVDFSRGGTTVRTGKNHTLDNTSGKYILDLPNDVTLSKGSFQAKLYVGSALTATSNFSLISTPKLSNGFMITGKAWDAYNPQSKAIPQKSASFPANVARVAVFFNYTGASTKDSYYVAVYDKDGALVHRSQNHKVQYVPDGHIALILPADSGAYGKGSYRTDVYVDGAQALSVPWGTK